MGFLGFLGRTALGAITGGPIGAVAAAAGPEIARRLSPPGGRPTLPPLGSGGTALALGAAADPCAPRGRCRGGLVGGVCLLGCAPLETRTRAVVVGPGGAGGVQRETGPLTVSPEVAARFPEECVCPGVSPAKPCRCCLPGGGQGVTNKSRYFRKTDRCADPDDAGSYELVTRGTRCVKRRSIDPGNSRAARRAITRLNAHHRQLQATQKALERIARPRARRRRAA